MRETTRLRCAGEERRSSEREKGNEIKREKRIQNITFVEEILSKGLKFYYTMRKG